MAKIDEYRDFHPLNREFWREWLAENHGQTGDSKLNFRCETRCDVNSANRENHSDSGAE